MPQRELPGTEAVEQARGLPSLMADDLAGKAIHVKLHVALSWAGGPVGLNVPIRVITPPSKRLIGDAIRNLLEALGYTRVHIDDRRETSKE